MFISPPHVYLINLVKLYSPRMFLPVIITFIFFIRSIDAVIWVNETEDFHGTAIILNLFQGVAHDVEDQNAGMKVFQGNSYAHPLTGDLR